MPNALLLSPELLLLLGKRSLLRRASEDGEDGCFFAVTSYGRVCPSCVCPEEDDDEEEEAVDVLFASVVEEGAAVVAFGCSTTSTATKEGAGFASARAEEEEEGEAGDA